MKNYKSAAVDTMIGTLLSPDLFMTKGIIIVFIKSSGRCVKNDMSAAVDTMIGTLLSPDLFMTKCIIIVFIKSSGRCVKNYMYAAVDTMIGSITALLLVDVHFVFITGLLLATTSSVRLRSYTRRSRAHIFRFSTSTELCFNKYAQLIAFYHWLDGIYVTSIT